jgi:hypothetical protein
VISNWMAERFLSLDSSGPNDFSSGVRHAPRTWYEGQDEAMALAVARPRPLDAPEFHD